MNGDDGISGDIRVKGEADIGIGGDYGDIVDEDGDGIDDDVSEGVVEFNGEGVASIGQGIGIEDI